MGQRHQIYVVSKKDKKFTPLGAFHHQWCYGMNAVVNLTRAVELLRKNIERRDDWCEYTCRDEREIETVIKATYGVSLGGYVSMVHNCNDHLIDDERTKILPQNGDNNDGCGLILIDHDEKQIRLGMFTPNHIEGSHGDGVKPNFMYSREEYLFFYYSAAEQNETKFIEGFADELQYLKKAMIFNSISQAEFDLMCGRKPKSSSPKPKKTKTVETPKNVLTMKTKKKLSPLEAYNARMNSIKGDK